MPTFQSSDGVQLFYQDWGRGEPIVFVHSWALDSQMWAPHMLHFNKLGKRTVAMDRRGHGRSDQPGSGYNYDRLADDLAELLEQLDLRDVTLVAHSMGAGECTRLLTRHGRHRIARAIYLAPPAPRRLAADGQEVVAAMVEPELEAIRRDFPHWLEQGADGFYLPSETGTTDGTIRRTIDTMLNASLHAVIACFLTRVCEDFRDELRQFNVPLLILHGDRDESEPIEHGRATARIVPGSRIVEYVDAPHGMYHTHRTQVLADVRSFMDEAAA